MTLALNAANDLPLTLESVIGQDYAGIEAIVLDGQSWDGSAEVLRRYRRDVKTIVSVEDAGIYDGMNRALEWVTGDYVIYMNAGDQFFTADAVTRMVQGIEGNPDIFYGNHVHIDRHFEKFQRAAAFGIVMERLRSGKINVPWLESIPGHQATFTAAPLLRHLRYDTRFTISADHDLLFRAHAAGATLHHIDETVAHYRGGGVSAQMAERTRIEGCSIYRRHSDNPASVDRFFFGDASPFQSQTERIGVKLGGFCPVSSEGAAEFPSPWAAGEMIDPGGALIQSPPFMTDNIDIHGTAQSPGQRLDLLLGERLLASFGLDSGDFRLLHRFSAALEPGTEVRLHVTPGQRSDAAEVSSVCVRSFRFWSGAPDVYRLPIGARIAATSETEQIRDMLNAGWASSEETHTWSVGGESDLWIGADSNARHIRIEVSANPHVSGEQSLGLCLNREWQADVALVLGQNVVLEIDCTDPRWRPDTINHVLLRPSAHAAPPPEMGDSRELGICLWSIAVD